MIGSGMTEITPDEYALMNEYVSKAAVGGIERGFPPKYLAAGLLFAAMELARQEFGPDAALTWLEEVKETKRNEQPQLWFPDRRPTLTIVPSSPESGGVSE